MGGSITARTLDYFALFVAASIMALFSALVIALCVKFEERGLGWFLGSILFWFCTGRRVVLGEVAVRSGISICPGTFPIRDVGGLC